MYPQPLVRVLAHVFLKNAIESGSVGDCIGFVIAGAYQLNALIEHFNEMKEDAILDADFESAASLRDQTVRLLKMKEWLLQERRRFSR